MLVQVKAIPVHFNIIQVYTPTSERKDEEIKNFIAQITTLSTISLEK